MTSFPLDQYTSLDFVAVSRLKQATAFELWNNTFLVQGLIDHTSPITWTLSSVIDSTELPIRTPSFNPVPVTNSWDRSLLKLRRLQLLLGLGAVMVLDQTLILASLDKLIASSRIYQFVLARLFANMRLLRNTVINCWFPDVKSKLFAWSWLALFLNRNSSAWFNLTVLLPWKRDTKLVCILIFLQQVDQGGWKILSVK